MSKDKGLGMELSKVLFKHEPKLLEADHEATIRAAVAVADLLGCIMASVMVLRPREYEEAFLVITKRAHKSAMDTATKALNDKPNVTQQ